MSNLSTLFTLGRREEARPALSPRGRFSGLHSPICLPNLHLSIHFIPLFFYFLYPWLIIWHSLQHSMIFFYFPKREGSLHNLLTHRQIIFECFGFLLLVIKVLLQMSTTIAFFCNSSVFILKSLLSLLRLLVFILICFEQLFVILCKMATSFHLGSHSCFYLDVHLCF